MQINRRFLSFSIMKYIMKGMTIENGIDVLYILLIAFLFENAEFDCK